MRPHIKGGRLIAPKTLPEAIRWRKAAHKESKRVREQMDDPNREVGHDPAAYAEWRRRAGLVLEAYRLEEKLLIAWIDGWRSADAFARKLYELACTIDAEDLDGQERQILVEGSEYFASVLVPVEAENQVEVVSG